MKPLVIILFLILSTDSFAKKRRPVPLLPKRGPVSTQQEYRVETTRSKSRFGLEGGVLGRFQNTSGSILGMAMGFGIKGNWDIPVSERFHFVPHVGYFFESEGEAGASVKTHSILAGAQGLFDMTQRPRLVFRLGIEASVLTALRQVSVLNSSVTNPMDFEFIGGPKIQIGRRTNGGGEWSFNVVPTYSSAQQFYLFLTFGFLFR